MDSIGRSRSRYGFSFRISAWKISSSVLFGRWSAIDFASFRLLSTIPWFPALHRASPISRLLRFGFSEGGWDASFEFGLDVGWEGVTVGLQV